MPKTCNRHEWCWRGFLLSLIYSPQKKEENPAPCMFFTLSFANEKERRHLWALEDGDLANIALDAVLSPVIGGKNQSAGQVVFVQKRPGCLRDETLNCECLPSVGSSASQRSALSYCFLSITIRWSVLLSQAGPESTGLTNPRRQRSTLNSSAPALRTNTLRPSVSLHVFRWLSLSLSLSPSLSHSSVAPIYQLL